MHQTSISFLVCRGVGVGGGRSGEFVYLRYLPLLAPSLKISTQNMQLFFTFFFLPPTLLKT